MSCHLMCPLMSCPLMSQFFKVTQQKNDVTVNESCLKVNHVSLPLGLSQYFAVGPRLWWVKKPAVKTKVRLS